MDSFEKVLPRLKKISLFEEFDISSESDREILHAVYNVLSLKKYRAKETIIKEGQDDDLFFILYDGEVLITRKTPADDVIALATLNAEQNIFFGEMTLISNNQRSATVTAKTDCLTLSVSGKKFQELFEIYPILGLRVLKVLSRQLANTVSGAVKALVLNGKYDEIGQKYPDIYDYMCLKAEDIRIRDPFVYPDR